MAYEALLRCEVFTPLLAPFSTRTCGPDWFIKKFPATEVEDEAETNALWQAYLTPTLLSRRNSASKTSDSSGLCGYQPNLNARQFGLVQPKPSSLHKCSGDLKRPTKEHTWRVLLQRAQEQILPSNLSPLHYHMHVLKHFLDGGKNIIGNKLVK